MAIVYMAHLAIGNIKVLGSVGDIGSSFSGLLCRRRLPCVFITLRREAFRVGQ
jgi:hypothetical protein